MESATENEDELVQRIKDCWASLFGMRVLFY